MDIELEPCIGLPPWEYPLGCLTNHWLSLDHLAIHSARKPEEKRQVLPKFLEKDELKKFIEVSRFVIAPNYWAYFLLLAYTGLRPAEAAELQWGDIDTKNQTIDVNKQLDASSVLRHSFAPTKNEQSERLVTYGIH